MSTPKKLALFAITWPLFIESSLQMFMRTADTFMVSKVSDAAVASVGVSNQLILFAFLLLQVVSAGTAIVISQYLGANKTSDVKRFAAGAIVLNLAFGLAVSFAMIVFSRPLLGLFGLQPELLGQARTYLVIVGGALFVQAVNLTISAITQVHGFTRYTMMVSVGMNLLNLTGNFLFIFGPGGFPKLGVPGVAISAVISQCVALAAYGFILRKVVRLPIGWKSFLQCRKDDLKKIIAVGIPTGSNQLSYSASQLVTTYFITSLGAELLSTRIYTQNIMYFIMVLAISLGRGTMILIGRLVGAGDKESAYRQLYRSLRLSMLLSLCAVTVIVAFRKPLLGLFTQEADIISLGAFLLCLGFLLEPGRCLNIVIGEALRASGDARFIVITGLLVIWGVSIPLTYLLGLHFGFGLIGIWIVFIIDEWVRGFILLYRWRSRAWESKVLVKPESKPASAGA
ncbi:putative FMN/FAD exporter YeeO [Paenibacillus solanacearum]|uniref:FMN/FAD exporter YeeO n=1 Tax=Paenibacillus solanacearum TaxID=2048548 RepID=A0A916JSG1_9BACL|nr:MATE family efflux transporter [Paenibacillus solanacearum]CAG7598827.1 putative FMN/FAD exporter YeeO [Paenibacillus solanacearum]